MAGLKKARRAAAKASAAQAAKQKPSPRYQTRVLEAQPASAPQPAVNPFVKTTGDMGKP